MIKEITRTAASDYLALVVLPLLTILFGWGCIQSATANHVMPAWFQAVRKTPSPYLNTGSLYT